MTRCVGTTKTGRRCRRRAAPGESLCSLHLAGGAYSPEVADRLVAAVGAGADRGTAARAVGISPSTLRIWLLRGARGEEPYAQLLERVTTARDQGEVRQLASIATAAGQGEWRAGAWLLERRFRAEQEEEREPLDLAGIADAAASAARAEAEATLAVLGESTHLSAGAVDRYAAAVAAWASLEAQWQHVGRPGMTLGGATGNALVPHPLVGQIAVSRREAAQLANLLGLDPLGRLKLARHIGAGRPAGAASAADRAAGPPRRRLRAVE